MHKQDQRLFYPQALILLLSVIPPVERLPKAIFITITSISVIGEWPLLNPGVHAIPAAYGRQIL